jgi:hypothetical protein
MYKKASQNQQYLTRSGSQGTRVLRKPYLTDLNTEVLDISYTADMEAKNYASVLEEREALMKIRDRLQEQLNHIHAIRRAISWMKKVSRSWSINAVASADI